MVLGDAFGFEPGVELLKGLHGYNAELSVGF
jgi:hypothetical protein